ncbi:WD domain, G-beta repeat containing protein/chromatin assembly complex protein [Blumeria hordei DH14]|uniref:WD domain, G-beta repeat containing protein/chromatin assembly complex protein n=1 Tax=Blumeria graminis f. sp. hordei (strain DH14) TaxID=546991 RepID=N1JH40_BLUG1|nr:WD domain, G-beta repeat containing protein/chromatin assembly complex protein [Blumeria hordei DH14]
MKASPIIVNWHSETAPIYSADFQPSGKGRLATGGGDNNVRLWGLESDGEETKVEYLCTMAKHTQAVNVVRWAPKGDILASASDDGNVITWILDTRLSRPAFGEEGIEDKECWRTKTMVRTLGGSEVYDLAWSPDGLYFLTGSMDNVARIYNAQTGHIVRQIAEHQHYVQGVAWDPLNEYIATQSSDRSVHIYTLKTKEGSYTLDTRDDPDKGLGKVGINLKMDLPRRRIPSNSPAPPDPSCRSHMMHGKEISSFEAANSPVPSCPSTPTSMAVTMNPPSTISRSRRSSVSTVLPTIPGRRSASPAPSIPLPAVMPMEASPKTYAMGMGVRNSNIYANDTLKSFFRRLTFTPDGSLLLTPAGQYQSLVKGAEGTKNSYETTNTVYIYTRGGINKPPIAHLPGHKKPSIVVKCSPIFYKHRKSTPPTRHISMDTSSTDGNMAALPEPTTAIPKSPTPVMEPPPLVAPGDVAGSKSSSESTAEEISDSLMAFSMPYRIVYAVATEDTVYLYDTQQQTPLCIVSNLHCATFTDLSWSNDGLILLITSSDGFCSTLTFVPGELGEKYSGEIPNYKSHQPNSQTTPMLTPMSIAPLSPFSNIGHRSKVTPSMSQLSNRPRSNSSCSVTSLPPLMQSSTPVNMNNRASSLVGQTSPVNSGHEIKNGTTSHNVSHKRDATVHETDTSPPSADRTKKQKRVVPTPVASGED